MSPATIRSIFFCPPTSSTPATTSSRAAWGSRLPATESIFALSRDHSNLYETPIFEGAGFGEGMGFLRCTRTSRRAEISSDTIVSSKLTQIASAQWAPAKKLLLAFSGGVGANQPYGAASLNLSRKMDRCAWELVYAGTNFRRAVVTSPLQAEPTRGISSDPAAGSVAWR